MTESGPSGSGNGHGPDERLPRPRRRLRRKLTDDQREHRRRRIRRRGRRAYIRSVYSLPSLATLGNAICGFACIWVASFDSADQASPDHWTRFLVHNHFLAAAYLIFIAMLFDGLDGRLARFARHTTDFGGQLDSLADAISFGAAPAFLALEVFHSWLVSQSWAVSFPPVLSRSVWAIGVLYFCCAVIRLARFNVSNEHGEQHHFSFLGLPSPGAAAVVASWVLMQQDLAEPAESVTLLQHPALRGFADVLVWLLPVLVLASGLLMVSTIRYPHLVNRYLRGRRSIERVLAVLVVLLLLVVMHRYTLGVGTLVYAFWGPIAWGILRLRKRAATSINIAAPR